MKRVFVLISVFVVVFSLMIVPAFGASEYSSTHVVDQYTIGFDSPVPEGRYTLRIQIGDYFDVTDPFELRWGGCELYVDGIPLYAIGTEDFVNFELFELDTLSFDYEPVDTADLTLTFVPYLEDSEFFLESIIAVLVGVISWIGLILHALISKDGALHSILPVFAIGISITALFFAIRAIRSFIWGA